MKKEEDFESLRARVIGGHEFDMFWELNLHPLKQ